MNLEKVMDELEDEFLGLCAADSRAADTRVFVKTERDGFVVLIGIDEITTDDEGDVILHLSDDPEDILVVDEEDY